jgi:hypothetical protein
MFGRRVHHQETRTAIYRASLRRVKRNGRVCVAARAIDGDFDFLFDAGKLCGLRGGDAIVFRFFAVFATLWGVLQTFVVEKLLLAARPYKFLIAVNAKYLTVFKLRFSFLEMNRNSVV